MPSSRFAAPPHGRWPLNTVMGKREFRAKRVAFPSTASFSAALLQKLRLDRRQCQHGVPAQECRNIGLAQTFLPQRKGRTE